MSEQTSYEIRGIKPLEWEKFGSEQFIVDAQLRGGSTAVANGILGQYQVWGDGSWAGCGVMHQGRKGGTLDSGMIEAQQDYEQRIYSAIEWV